MGVLNGTLGRVLGGTLCLQSALAFKAKPLNYNWALGGSPPDDGDVTCSRWTSHQEDKSASTENQIKVLQEKKPIAALDVCKRVASPEGKDEKIFPTTSEYSACFLFCV